MIWALGLAAGALLLAIGATRQAMAAEKKISILFRCIDELHERLRALDPQFDDERALLDDFNNDRGALTGMALMEIQRKKEAAGKLTLSSPLLPRE